MPLSVQQLKLSVSFSGSCPPKLSVSITINYLVHFGLITVDIDSLESFVRSHYPFWMIHNFASDNFFPSKISNENEFQWELLCPPRVHYCRGCWYICAPEQIYLKNCGGFPEKPVDSSGCAAAIELSKNNGSSNEVTEEMARDRLKDLFQPLISQLCEEKWRIKEQRRYLWWFLQITLPNIYCENQYWEMHKWVLDYCRQCPTFQLPFLIIVTDKCQKSYIPGNFRTQFFIL